MTIKLLGVNRGARATSNAVQTWINALIVGMSFVGTNRWIIPRRIFWSDAGYHCYQSTTLDSEQRIFAIVPHAQVTVGDTFTIRISYKDSSYEDIFITASYFIRERMRIASCNDGHLPILEPLGNHPCFHS